MAEGNIIYSRAGSSDEQRGREEEELYKQIEELNVNETKGRMVRCERCVADGCPESEGSWSDDVLRSEWLERARQLYGRCESCVGDERPGSERGSQWYGRVAVFLCFLCRICVCAECMSEHGGHHGMSVGRQEREENESDRMREQGERERERRQYIDMESERRRREIFNNSHAIVYDRVEVKHELDQEEECYISGLCVLENKRWVACDCNNSCIKIYKVGSHVLQRYIQFVGSYPEDVTEIHLEQNSAEPNLASGSISDISAADRADPDIQCLIAVTLPGKHQIMFIDISKKPAKLQKVLKTERECYSIQFCDDKIFTLCKENHETRFGSRWSVYIKSTDGVTQNKFDIDIYHSLGPQLAVVSGRVYITDEHNDKVQCRNVEGQVSSEFTIEGSEPRGICVDPDNNVYVCAYRQNKVYKLDSDLTRYESVLDQTAFYIENALALCCYRDKLFISHVGSPSLENFVTVVRLL